MAFLKYSNLPIFAKFDAEQTDPVKNTANNLFAASEASLSLDANLTTTRYLGSSAAEMPASGPLEGKMSFTFYPLIEKADNNASINLQKSNQLAFFKLTGDFSVGHNIYFSNFLLKKSYLQNYSMKINSYQPISISANFISYDTSSITNTKMVESTNVPQIAKNKQQSTFEGLHALTTTFSSPDSDSYLPDLKISIEINVDCNRSPVYQLGQSIASKAILNTVERTITIQGENIGKVIDLNGKLANFKLAFNPLSAINAPAATPVYEIQTLNAKVVSQQLSVSQGSNLNGRVVIKEIIL